MRFPSRNSGPPRPLDLIPVVNVVLLLTFFFLLSWSFVLQPGVEVRLPSTGFSQGSPQGRHVITLKNHSKDNVMIFFDERVVSERELGICLSGASDQNSGEWITLNADESISHGRVQEVASLAMEKGFRVTIATQRPSSQRAGAVGTANPLELKTPIVAPNGGEAKKP